MGGELGVRSISRDTQSCEPAAPTGGYIGLLLNDTARTSMTMLAEHGALDHSVHMDRVCKSRYISESTFNRIHKQLVQCGLVACMPAARNRSCRVDHLRPLARELLQFPDEVAAVERWAPSGLRGPDAVPLLNTIADTRAWLIARQLSNGPFRYSELSARLPALAEGTLNDVLRSLIAAGLVRIDDGTGPDRRCYALTELVPALARAILRLARFHRQITPRKAPWLTGDLASFVRLLEGASGFRIPRSVCGTVLLQVVQQPWEKRGWPDVELALRHGRVVIHWPEERGPSATVRASPEAWVDVALLGNANGINIYGDTELARTLLGAVGAAVASCPRP